MKTDSHLARHIDTVVQAAIKNYARRCERLDREDLRQCAWVACLAAVQTYKVGSGTLSGYLWRAAVLSIRREMWAASTITSGHWHRPDVSVPKVSQTSTEEETPDQFGRAHTYAVILIDDTPMPEELAIAAEIEERAIAAMLEAGASVEASRAFCAGLAYAGDLPREAVLRARAAVRVALQS